ncbi:MULTISPECIES: hypothetical protein [Halostella]|uniref:hypothetical protein n=1 Tax=Halostella TaxID=1843185 RepID=UPI001081AABC|nr:MULTISPECIES: hypothetical protein [Halostella]
MNRPESSTPRSGAQRSRKAILVCPECGHESPPDGDWDVREENHENRVRETYSCPVCGATVTTRPRFTERHVVTPR